MNPNRSFSQRKVYDYDYGYVAAFLKAREHAFLSKSMINRLYQSVTLEELFPTLQNTRYASIPFTMDAKDFENYLWNYYFYEIEQIQSTLPEEYIQVFLPSLHSVVFLQEEMFPFHENLLFSKRLHQFFQLANQGTSFTKRLAAYITDRFSIFECIRLELDDTHSFVPSSYPSGQISASSLKLLFQSKFETVEIDLLDSLWMEYIVGERPVKQYDFNFLYRFESFWWNLFQKIMREPSWQSTGPDYVISYFGRFILEIEMIKKLFICTRYHLPCHNLKEIITHAA